MHIISPNNESIQNKTIILPLRMPKYLLPNTNNRKGTLFKKRKGHKRRETVTLPKNTIIVNLEGKSIYPSFIDMYTTLNGKAKRAEGGGRQNPCTIQKKAITE
jgi:hypothetical protein